jgi:hypothetical protein
VCEPISWPDVDVGLIGGRDLVRVAEDRSPDAVVITEFRQHPREGRIAGLDLGQERCEGILLGRRHRGQGVEGRQDEPLLLLGELNVDDGHRGLLAADRQLHPEVSVDDMPRRPVHEDLRHPADL